LENGHLDDAALSSAEAENAWSYTSAPPILFHGEVVS